MYAFITNSNKVLFMSTTFIDSTPTTDPISFIDKLEIVFPRHRIERLSPINFQRRALESAEEGKAESYVSNKSIISFVSNVTEQARQDVLNSTLIAQLAADKKFPEEGQMTDWFKKYQETLTNIGWTVQGKEFSKFQTSQSIFEMDNVIIDILTTAIGGSALAIIVKTIQAFKKLSDIDNRLLAFEKNTHTLTKGTFLIAIVDETNEALSMKIGAFLLTASNEIRQILFFKSTKDKTELSYSSSDCIFNSDVYSIVRNSVLTKLGNKASEYIAEIDI
jgi:hypothetical protein